MRIEHVATAGALGVFLSCSWAMAQPSPGLRVVVEDQSGGVIAGADVVAINTANQERHEETSDEAGRAAFGPLPPGEYALRVEAPSFAPLERTVTVRAGTPQIVRLQLTIGLTAEVTVEAFRREPRPSPETVDLDNGTIFEAPLPMGGGQLLAFLDRFMSPAAQSIGGVTVLVDGADVGRLSVPTAAVQRIVVNKTPFSAEYQKPGKARVEVITENGSRQHFEVNTGLFFSDSSLDARNALADVKPKTDKTLFEGGISGPLVRNRASFFAAWEYLRDHQSVVVNARTPAGPVIQTAPTSQGYTYGLGRVDVRLNQLLTFTARYDFAREIEEGEGVGGVRLPALAATGREIEHAVRFRAAAILSPRFANDLRVSVERATDREGGPASGPQILVRGAFRGGSSQTFTSDRSTEVLIQNTATRFQGAHTLRVGGQVQSRFFNAFDRSNFGGVFEFASLDLYSAGIPSVFRVNQGAADATFSVSDGALFVQDDIRVVPSLTLMLGARYDWQSVLSDRNNVAPRFGVTWSPDGTTVIRGGAGLFYERLPERLLRESRLYDGARTTEVVIANPAYPNALGSGEVLAPPASVVRLRSNLSAPYLTQASAGVERQVWDRTFLTAEYLHLRGDRLYRTRNVNAPMPGGAVRPDPRFVNINQIESTAILRSHALSLGLIGRIGGDINLRGHYTYSRNTNDISGPLALPANNYDLRLERGRADFDLRHRFDLMTSFEFPAELTLGSILSLNSAPPYDITTGFDDNGDTVARDRPVGTARNSGRGFGFAQLDLRLVKEFEFGPSLDEDPTEPGELDFYVDVFNVLNRANYDDVIGVQTSPLFGRPTLARQPRTIQFSVRYSF
jgi:carboxypeptidase family protein/TonB-dependent receptor-like protein